MKTIYRDRPTGLKVRSEYTDVRVYDPAAGLLRPATEDQAAHAWALVDAGRARISQVVGNGNVYHILNPAHAVFYELRRPSERGAGSPEDSARGYLEGVLTPEGRTVLHEFEDRVREDERARARQGLMDQITALAEGTNLIWFSRNTARRLGLDPGPGARFRPVPGEEADTA